MLCNSFNWFLYDGNFDDKLIAHDAKAKSKALDRSVMWEPNTPSLFTLTFHFSITFKQPCTLFYQRKSDILGKTLMGLKVVFQFFFLLDVGISFVGFKSEGKLSLQYVSLFS